MLRNYIILFCLLLGQVSTSSAQLHQEFINYIEEGLGFIEQEVDPIGLSIAVKSGSDQWNGTIGISSVQDALNEESVFSMGSISKTLISACILGMMEDGKLTLQDPISNHLQTFQNIDPAITIMELLNHTSGLFNYTNHPNFTEAVLSEMGQTHTYTEQEVIDTFVAEPDFLPGEKQEYSNTNYLLLGMIITEISQRPYYDEIISRFDMTTKYPSISIPPYLSELGDLAHLWADVGNGFTDVHEDGFDLTGAFTMAGAAGAFVSKPKDLVQWGSDLYTGKLLNQSSMDSMFNYHPFGLAGVIPYGLGVYESETECGVKSVGHGGNLIYTSDLQYVEAYDLTIAVMTNDARGLEDIGGVSGIAQELICNYESTLTSVHELNSTRDVVIIFPNPTIDEITIESKYPFDQIVSVVVYDYKGSMIHETKVKTKENSRFTLNVLSNFPAGMYSIGLFDSQHSSAYKVVKQ